jgi:hypothetical protein
VSAVVAFRSREVPETLCVGVMVRVEAKLDTLPRKRPRAARVFKVPERLRALHVLEASAVPVARATWVFLLRLTNIARVRPTTPEMRVTPCPRSLSGGRAMDWVLRSRGHTNIQG